jgi:hypothetical protein
MRPQVLSFDWGMWVLGDLPELLSRAMDVLGASAAVTAAHVVPPDESQPLPEVHLEVTDREEAARLRGEADSSEFIAHFEPDYGGAGWACRVAGLRLQVTVQEVA